MFKFILFEGRERESERAVMKKLDLIQFEKFDEQ